jgi:hypothetical protein
MVGHTWHQSLSATRSARPVLMMRGGYKGMSPHEVGPMSTKPLNSPHQPIRRQGMAQPLHCHHVLLLMLAEVLLQRQSGPTTSCWSGGDTLLSCCRCSVMLPSCHAVMSCCHHVMPSCHAVMSCCLQAYRKAEALKQLGAPCEPLD